MSSSELAQERDYVHGLYRRLDSLRAAAQQQLEAVRRSAPGGTHQNRSERDAFARIYEDRVGQLREIDERLAFGRLEMEPEDNSSERVLRYIGRIGLRDEDQVPLLLDWRVPQARAFYQATAATPLGARARRHLQSSGRDIVRIDDEIFDSAILESDVASLQGEAALMVCIQQVRQRRCLGQDAEPAEGIGPLVLGCDRSGDCGAADAVLAVAASHVVTVQSL